MTPIDDSSFDLGIPQGPAADSAALSPLAKFAWTALILATLYICYFHNLGAIGLVGPDEPRYAWIARDMAESNDWVTPRLYGKPWFEKPILYYWGAAASFKLFGVSEVSARLPSALSALLATLAMAWLALKLYGREAARWLLLLLPTTVAMIGFSHAAATDMPFSGTLTVAMVFAAVILGLTRDEHSPVIRPAPWLALLCFGFFLGLAVLAKGPAAIVLSGGAVVLWAALTKRWRDALRCLHPVALSTFCLTAFPWYILCARRNPDFFRIFIIEHNFKRFLTPEFQHVQPFWYYVPVVLTAFLPWTVALVCAASSAFLACARGHRLPSTTLFLLCWVLFCLFFFSISKSKLPGYILPSIPAIGLLLVRAKNSRAIGNDRIARIVPLSAGCLCAAAGCLLIVTHRYGAPGLSKLLLAIGIANIGLGIKRRSLFASVEISSFCVVPILLFLGFFPLVAIDFLSPDPSGKTLAAEITAKQVPLDRIYIANMRRGQQFSLNFYLHHETQQWNDDQPREGYIVVNAGNCSAHVRPPLVCVEPAGERTASGWFVAKIQQKD